MRLITLLVLLSIFHLVSGIGVTESIYEGAPHYIITTKTATYWFDRQGGGFSRMIDRNGNDWIAFKREPWNSNPASAASSYRGIPNLVFQGEDNGCGHPGWGKCESSLEAPNVIRTVSTSGKWEWTWTFFEDKAVMEVLKAYTSRTFWFLYEGPVGGLFDTSSSFWLNSTNGTKILTDVPDHLKGERITGNWNWVVFGYGKSKQMLRIIHHTFDDQVDSFSYMGNTHDGIKSGDGMVVFGFGRTADTKALLTGNQKFEISFITSGKLKKKHEK